MKQVFISDLHLEQGRQDLTLAFESFLADACADADELYILGDLFEVWLGDDDDSAFNQRIIADLAGLSCRLFLMHGNRDFLLGELFCRMTGASLLPDPSVITVGTQQVLLMHGDSLCTRDLEYMKARTQLRSSDFQAEFLSKTLAQRRTVARQIRGESKAHTESAEMAIMDVTPAEVVSAMQNAGVNILVHGHTHRPKAHELFLGEAPGLRYVLGDWRPETYYLQALDGKLSLHAYQ